MSTAENKALVLRAFDLLGKRDLPALFALIHEEGSWSVPFDPARFQYGGFRDKAGTIALLTEFLGGFDSFSFTVESVTAEEDRVIVEAHPHGTGPGGAVYRNNCLFIIFVRDGRLHTVREYFDPFKLLGYVEQLPETGSVVD